MGEGNDSKSQSGSHRPRARANLLWGMASVSNLGDGIRTAALPLLAISLTEDPIPVAVVAVCAWLPWLLFALPGRVTGAHRLLSYGAMPLGAALGGWVASAFGLRALMEFDRYWELETMQTFDPEAPSDWIREVLETCQMLSTEISVE